MKPFSPAFFSRTNRSTMRFMRCEMFRAHEVGCKLQVGRMPSSFPAPPRYGYCDCGALMYVTNAFGTAVEEVTHFLYDLQGNRTFVFYIEDRVYSVTHANGVTVTNTYDNLGRPRTRTYPDGGVEKFGYSARGVTAYTNQLNLVTYYTHDEAGRKTVETNANNEITKYAYNAAGDLATLTDGKTNVTTWNYDQYGRVTNKVDQASFEILRYQYSAAVGSHISAAACVTSIQQQWGSAAVGSFSSGVIQQQWGHISKFDN